MAKVLPYTNPDYVQELTGQTVALLHCEAATSIINKYMGNNEVIQSGGSVTKSYTGHNDYWLDLGFYPIKTVTSVVMDGVTLNYTGNANTSDYLLPSDHGEADGYLYNPNGWNLSTEGNIVVTFTYDTSADMELIRFVASMIAAYIKNETFTNVKQETIGTYSVQYVIDNTVGNTQIDRYLEMLPRHFSITSAGGVEQVRDIRDTLYNQYDINYYANGLN